MRLRQDTPATLLRFDPDALREAVPLLPESEGIRFVVIATHSPLVINELKPNEVTVVTRDDSGTHCKPIGETPGFADHSKVYALGELWLSYANGKDEAPLLKGGARVPLRCGRAE